MAEARAPAGIEVQGTKLAGFALYFLRSGSYATDAAGESKQILCQTSCGKTRSGGHPEQES